MLTQIEGTDINGTIDIIGLDVLEIMDPARDADEVLHEATHNAHHIIEINNRKFLVTTTLADLNRITSVLPEDLEPQVALPLQIKIAEILKSLGLPIDIDEETLEEEKKKIEDLQKLQKESEKIKEEALAELNEEYCETCDSYEA